MPLILRNDQASTDIYNDVAVLNWQLNTSKVMSVKV